MVEEWSKSWGKTGDREMSEELGGGDSKRYWRAGSGDREKQVHSRVIVEVESTGRGDWWMGDMKDTRGCQE